MADIITWTITDEALEWTESGETVTIQIVDPEASITVSDATPEDLGTAAAGTAATASRSDHVHEMPSASDVGADPAGTADSAVGTHTADSSAHHVRYADSEAVSAMGLKADSNPLNHDRPTDSDIETAYNNQVPAASQAEMEAGTEAGIRRFSPLRIAQAIAALAASAWTELTGTLTLSQLNSAVSDATLDDSAAARTPTTHGSDKHSVAYQGVLAEGAFVDGDKTKLDTVESSANNYSHPNHTGDVTSVGDGAQTIADNAVTLAKMADIETARILGRSTAGTGDPEALTKAQAIGLLEGTAIGDLVKLVDVDGSPGLPAVDGSQLTGIEAGGGGGYNEAFRPTFEYPDRYGNLSGHTGRWTASGSGTNEYYYTFDIPEPTDVLFNGSSATGGTIGSLTDHQWGWGDNDTLGYNTLYVRDDSGDPDGLPENLWMADWYGVDGATPAFADEEDFGFPVHFDNATDQGIVCKLKAIPADVTTWTLKMFVRSSDRSSSGTITVRALDRAIQTGGAAKPTATTLATATLSLTATGSIVTISGTIANLDATTGEIPEICIIRDVSEDAVATPMAADLDTVEVQYATA